MVRSRSRAPPQAARQRTEPWLLFVGEYRLVPSPSRFTGHERRELTAANTATDVVGRVPYTIRVANNLTTCFTDADVNVVDNTLPMAITGVTATDAGGCAASNYERGRTARPDHRCHVERCSWQRGRFHVHMGWRCGLWQPAPRSIMYQALTPTPTM